jgi:hypothetical protein
MLECELKDFNIVVARIPNSSDDLLIVPFDENLEFNQRSTFTDSEFLVFLRKLGIQPDEAEATLERSRPAPRSFELRLALSDTQVKYAWSHFPPDRKAG